MDGCYKCKKRTIEPNCHNPEICEYWKKKLERDEVKYTARRENVLNSRPLARFQKSRGVYISGTRNR